MDKVSHILLVCYTLLSLFNIIDKRKPRRLKSVSKTSADNDEESTLYKDPTLVIFRALGKVLHCKRLDSLDESEMTLPAHLRHHVRHEMAFNPEQVIWLACAFYHLAILKAF